MKIYDIAVIGGGAAGSMAAIRAASLGKKTVLVERNETIGKKIFMTGKGRCNVTNVAPIEAFIEKFGKKGEFFRTALFEFSNEDLIEFLKSTGLETKTERQGRVFPVTDNAKSVVEALKKCLAYNKVEMFYGARVSAVMKKNDHFKIEPEAGGVIEARRVILSSGGASYKATGSMGDGFRIAKELGHTVTALKGALVPLKTKEAWVKDLQGLGLENIRLVFEYGKKHLASEIGELMFTHFGVSGPLILDLSGKIIEILDDHKEIKLYIDLKPGLNEVQIENRLLGEFKARGKASLSNMMKSLLLHRMILKFLDLTGIDGEKAASQITQGERRAIAGLLKKFPLTITGSLALEEAMVTAGGVSQKEINPRTMESKIVPGLYFAGEIIEGAASSGGYNLQAAFSTGYLAGERAATCEG